MGIGSPGASCQRIEGNRLGLAPGAPGSAHRPDEDVSQSSGCEDYLGPLWVLCIMTNSDSLPPTLPFCQRGPSGSSLQHLRFPPSLLLQTSCLQGPSSKFDPPAAHAQWTTNSPHSSPHSGLSVQMGLPASVREALQASLLFLIEKQEVGWAKSSVGKELAWQAWILS